MTSIIETRDYMVSNPRLYQEEIPQDLWVEIFVRASVKSLLRVKCVCRCWRTLVNNPSFTKKHLQFQKGKNKSRFLLQHCDEEEITSYLLFDEASVASAVMSSSSYNGLCHSSFKTPGICCEVYVEGPVNGLYCVHGGYNRFVIWNPAIKEVGFLPLLEKSRIYGSNDLTTAHLLVKGIGFGPNPLNEEQYKVVLIGVFDAHYHDAYPLIYTSDTNEWRILESVNHKDLGYYSTYCSNNVYLHGFCYWLEQFGSFVLAFDMDNEVFKEISTPEYSSNLFGDLVVHNNHITLLVTNRDLYDIDIFELNVEESTWIKRKSIMGIRGVERSLGFWTNYDEMILVIDTYDNYYYQTVLYNTTTRGVTKIGHRGWPSYFKVLVYYESLVNVGGEITKYKGNHDSSLKVIWYFLNDEIDPYEGTKDFERLGL